jgi:hypothetical protein
MCGGLKYRYQDPATGTIMERKAFFPIPHVQIPVQTSQGIILMQWGRRQGEDLDFDVPITGWARISSLVEGKWNAYRPEKVRIPALEWMEKDEHKESHWFPMTAKTALLGVKIECNQRPFVYIVTRPAEPEFQQVHARMPMIVSNI